MEKVDIARPLVLTWWNCIDFPFAVTQLNLEISGYDLTVKTFFLWLVRSWSLYLTLFGFSKTRPNLSRQMSLQDDNRLKRQYRRQDKAQKKHLSPQQMDVFYTLTLVEMRVPLRVEGVSREIPSPLLAASVKRPVSSDMEECDEKQKPRGPTGGESFHRAEQVDVCVQERRHSTNTCCSWEMGALNLKLWGKHSFQWSWISLNPVYKLPNDKCLVHFKPVILEISTLLVKYAGKRFIESLINCDI